MARRLFVACANTNAVWVVDLATRAAIEQISVALYPNAPVGTTPNSLALSPDGTHDAGRQCRQQHRRGGRRPDARCEPGRGMGSGRLVSDVGAATRATARACLRAGRQGADERTATRADRSPAACASRGSTPGNMLQGALSIVPTPDAPALAGDDAPRLRADALQGRRAGWRPPTRRSPVPIPRPRRRARRRSSTCSTSSARTAPTIRSSATCPGQRRPSLTLFGEEITPNAHALARDVHPVRQFLRRRRGQLRRPRVFDGRVRDGCRREAVADQLRRPRHAVPERRRLQDSRSVRQFLGAAARLHLGFRQARERLRPQLRRVRRRGADAAARCAPTCPGLEGLVHPAYPPFDLGVPDPAARRHLARGVPAASSATATCRSCRSSGSATITRTARRPARRRRARWSPTTTSRSAASSRRSRTAATGRNRRSSSSRTTRRTGRITSTRIDRCCCAISPFSRRRARRQHALHDVGRAADDGADSRVAADEPVRRGCDADVQRVPANAGRSRRYTPSAGARVRSTRRTTGHRRARRRRCG